MFYCSIISVLLHSFVLPLLSLSVSVYLSLSFRGWFGDLSDDDSLYHLEPVTSDTVREEVSSYNDITTQRDKACIINYYLASKRIIVIVLMKQATKSI